MLKTKKRILSKSEIDNLLKDWFVRDGKTFVHATDKHRLDWEKTLAAGSAYSTYMLDGLSDVDLFKKAYPMAKDTLIAMMLPCKITLRIGAQEASYTDGKRIVLSTKVFEDVTMKEPEKLDVFLGLAVHEGSHVKYTDFDVVKTAKNKVVHYLANVIEDERIEILVGEDTPGLSRFLEKTKYYYFHKEFKKVFKGWDTMNDFEKITTIFLRLIRYPTDLREEDFAYLGDYIIRIKDVLVPYPVNSKEVDIAANKIYDIIKEFIVEEEKTKSEKGSGSKKDDEEKPESGKGVETPEDEKSDDGKKGEPKEIEITAADLEKIDRMLSDEKGVPAKVIAALKVLATLKMKEGTDETATFIDKDKYLIDELEGIVERPDSETFIIKEKENRALYQEAYSKIRQYVPSIARYLKAHSRGYKIIHRSLRTGHLDTNKLAEGMQGVPNIYMREGEVKTDHINVVLLGDESGSMSGDKIRHAMQTTILLKEALQTLPNVKMYIYGHTADLHGQGVTDIHVYHEPGYTPKFSLGSMKARSQNRDGCAILAVAKRVRKFNSNPCLMFVMSDGQPYSYNYYGDEAIKHTKESVLKTQKMGFKVIQIAIEHSYDPKRMFEHFVILKDMNTLARDLGSVVKKAVEKLAEIKIS